MKKCPVNIALLVAASLTVATCAMAQETTKAAPEAATTTIVDDDDVIVVEDDPSVMAAEAVTPTAPAPITKVDADEPVVVEEDVVTTAPAADGTAEPVIEATGVVEVPENAQMHVVKKDPGASNQQIVTLEFEDTSVSDIVKAFREVTEANIISGSSLTNLSQRVSVKLDRVPWHQGLSSILNTVDLKLTETPVGSSIYTITQKTNTTPQISKNFILTHASAVEVAKMFNSNRQQPIATPFASANVVVVKATEPEVEECERIIKTVDKAVPQVYIEARFVELSADASKELGLRWNSLGGQGIGLSSSKVSAGYDWTKATGLNNSVGRQLVGVGGGESPTAIDTVGTSESMNFGGVISATDFGLYWNSFAEENGVQTFSNPKIIVANENEALVDMTTKDPCVDVTMTRSGESQDQIDISTKLTPIPGKPSTEDVAFFCYGISLSVTPRVSPDGLITVDVIPSISSKTDTYTPAGVSTESADSKSAAVYSTYPVIYMQKLKTRFTMKDGSTAVIGGMSQSKETNIDTGIPLLRDIPWIGPRVFGWKSRSKEQKEIVIFVTVGIANPHNIPEDLGMPKNAIFARQVMKGEVKEPGDKPASTMLQLKD